MGRAWKPDLRDNRRYTLQSQYAFVIAGTQSGCGKTTISLALMAALKARGLRVQPFKVGPDFIDPGFHTQIAGLESRNLDGWMLSADYNRTLFRRLLQASDVAVVEGVMGLYDGYDGASESGSSAEMAKWLGLPVVLVVDARSMARSAAALVYGFSRFDPQLNLAGVIFNKIGGKEHLTYLKEAMAAGLPEIPVLGGIPRENPICIPERHLGLVTADEVFLTPKWQETVISLVERYVDLDLILRKAEIESSRSMPASVDVEVKPSARPAESIPIAVARDAAFCFYYPDNFDLMRAAGAELRFFSPLAGESLPENAAGLYMGGGYPELFAREISGNEGFLTAIRAAASRGMPIHAECGGLMVLSRFIEDSEGKRYPMAGLLPFGTRMLTRRKALGYTEVILRKPCLLGQAGLSLRGHEFHYSEIAEMDESSSPPLQFAYELRKRKHCAARLEGYMVGSVLASYVHLHWGSAPEGPAELVRRCLVYEETQKKHKAL